MPIDGKHEPARHVPEPIQTMALPRRSAARLLYHVANARRVHARRGNPVFGRPKVHNMSIMYDDSVIESEQRNKRP